MQVAYLTHDGTTNTFQEFMLSSSAADKPDAEGDASLQPGELRSVLEALQKTEELVSALPSGMQQVLPALEHTIHDL